MVRPFFRSKEQGKPFQNGSSLVDQSRVEPALLAGASGYLIKDAAPEELAVAIRAAHRGEVHLDAAVARRLMVSLSAPAGSAGDPFAGLSPREHEILRLIAEGRANKEIARRLTISERTARTQGPILRRPDIWRVVVPQQCNGRACPNRVHTSPGGRVW